MLSVRDRRVKIDGKKVNVIWYSITCCCGETYRSDEISHLKAKAELDKNMKGHVEECVCYDFLNKCAFDKYSSEKILEILDKTDTYSPIEQAQEEHLLDEIIVLLMDRDLNKDYIPTAKAIRALMKASPGL